MEKAVEKLELKTMDESSCFVPASSFALRMFLNFFQSQLTHLYIGDEKDIYLMILL